ncbi:MAG: hypothetical protein V1744_07525 [Candidatus Altiarchaeota archaeon]
MRIMLALFSILLLLMVSACFKKSSVFDVDCNTLFERQARSICIYNQTIALRNPTYCKDIPDLDLRAACIDEISVMLKGDYYCANHQKLSLKEACERKVGEVVRLEKLKKGSTQAT